MPSDASGMCSIGLSLAHILLMSKKVRCVLFLSLAVQTALAQGPDAAIVAGILSAWETHDVVCLGEDHGRKHDWTNQNARRLFRPKFVSSLNKFPAASKLAKTLLMQGPVLQCGRIEVRSIGPHQRLDLRIDSFYIVSSSTDSTDSSAEQPASASHRRRDYHKLARRVVQSWQ